MVEEIAQLSATTPGVDEVLDGAAGAADGRADVGEHWTPDVVQAVGGVGRGARSVVPPFHPLPIFTSTPQL